MFYSLRHLTRSGRKKVDVRFRNQILHEQAKCWVVVVNISVKFLTLKLSWRTIPSRTALRIGRTDRRRSWLPDLKRSVGESVRLSSIFDSLHCFPQYQTSRSIRCTTMQSIRQQLTSSALLQELPWNCSVILEANELGRSCKNSPWLSVSHADG